MMDNLDFSLDEIQEQLALLGYKNIPKHRLLEFKQDLDELIQHGEWKSLTSPTHLSPTESPSDKSLSNASRPSPPAYTKEKVGWSYLEDCGEGFYLHAGQSNHDRQVLTSCLNRDIRQQQGLCDSYAQHSVAPKFQLPSGAPTRLQVEPDPNDSLHPPLTESYTSSPDTQERRFVKRKVLRKHKGQSLVCDESVYSEDSVNTHSSHTPAGGQVTTMYKTYNTQSDDDKDSLSSSFWSDGEHQEDEKEEKKEEKLEIEQKIPEQDLKPRSCVEEASEEEKPELNNLEKRIQDSSDDGGDSKSTSNTDDSSQEASDEEKSNGENTSGGSSENGSEEEEEVSEEESQADADTDDYLQEASDEEEKPEMKDKGDDSEGISDEEEGEVSEVDAETDADTEDSLQEASEPSEDGSDGEDGDEEGISEEAVEETEDSFNEASEEGKMVQNNQNEKGSKGSESGGDKGEEEFSKSEEDSKPLSKSDGSLKEAFKEEKLEPNVKDDKSFYSSEGGSDEEEEEQEEEPVRDYEDSLTEASEEEKLKLSKQENTTGEFMEGGSDEEEEEEPVREGEDSLTEASEEEKLKLNIEDNTTGESSECRSDKGEEEEEEEPVCDEDSPTGASEEEKLKTIYQDGTGDILEGGSDKEKANEKKEEEQLMTMEDLKPVGNEDVSLNEALEMENPELNNQGNAFWDSWEDIHDDDKEEDMNEDEEEEVIERVFSEEDSSFAHKAPEEKNPEDKGNGDDEEKCCSSSSESPAPSLMTSGYGTYRPEEQEGGEYRDDHTIAEFDLDSRGDFSEMRDEEDDRSLCSFGGFSDYEKIRGMSVLADSRLNEEVDNMGVKAEEDEKQVDEGTNIMTSEEHLFRGEDEEGGRDVEADAEDRGESDETSSNNDVKFIDSKVQYCAMTYEKMCDEWEGNLRRRRDFSSCLEERLAELHLSSTAQRDFETEDEDVSRQGETQSSEAEEISVSAFESYIRGMTRSQSDGDIRPKPKSFIRPVIHQPAIKKTDPVAKYFQYKQLWEMFKLPGETDRRAIRQEIREQLAYQPPPPKPRRVYVPNTYIVPTEKKRSALRWEIRNDLANGLLPQKFGYRF